MGNRILREMKLIGSLFAGCLSFATAQNATMKCHTCEVYQDHQGNIIGAGNPACWDDPTKGDFLRECLEPGDICVTDFIVDWLPRGEMTYHISRHCGHPSEIQPHCHEEDYQKWMWKDCKSGCTEEGCNTDFEELAKKFDAGNGDMVCHTCAYARNFDGSIMPNSNDNCGLPDVTDKLGTGNEYKCPIYANAGCYMSSTFIKQGTGYDNNIHDDHKGCSTFKTDKKYCEDFVLDGQDYTSCKETCTSNQCNFFTHQAEDIGASSTSLTTISAFVTTLLFSIYLL